MAANARPADEEPLSKVLLATFCDDLLALRGWSTHVARLRRRAILKALHELGRDPDQEIARILELMSQIENDLRRIRRKLMSACGGQ